MAREKKSPPTLVDYMANRVKTLRNELEGAIRQRDAMLQVVQLNPQDSWAAGMARHYTRRAEQLAQELGCAVAAAERTIAETPNAEGADAASRDSE